jgi:hypothetical protein
MRERCVETSREHHRSDCRASACRGNAPRREVERRRDYA